MSNIQFEEGYNQVNSQYYQGSQSGRGLTAWLVNKGIVKDAKSAQVVLLVVAIVCFGLAFYLIKGDSPTRTPASNVPGQSAPNLSEILNR